MCHWHGKKAQVYFLPKLGKESPYDHFNFFSTEMVGKASFLYHINEDNNVQAKLSASQYGFSCWSCYGNCFA